MKKHFPCCTKHKQGIQPIKCRKPLDWRAISQPKECILAAHTLNSATAVHGCRNLQFPSLEWTPAGTHKLREGRELTKNDFLFTHVLQGKIAQQFSALLTLSQAGKSRQQAGISKNGCAATLGSSWVMFPATKIRMQAPLGRKNWRRFEKTAAAGRFQTFEVSSGCPRDEGSDWRLTREWNLMLWYQNDGNGCKKMSTQGVESEHDWSIAVVEWKNVLVQCNVMH